MQWCNNGVSCFGKTLFQMVIVAIYMYVNKNYYLQIIYFGWINNQPLRAVHQHHTDPSTTYSLHGKQALAIGRHVIEWIGEILCFIPQRSPQSQTMACYRPMFKDAK